MPKGKRLVSAELTAADLKELDEWKARNQQERYQMLDDYAEWLRKKGKLYGEPNEDGSGASGR